MSHRSPGPTGGGTPSTTGSSAARAHITLLVLVWPVTDVDEVHLQKKKNPNFLRSCGYYCIIILVSLRMVVIKIHPSCNRVSMLDWLSACARSTHIHTGFCWRSPTTLRCHGIVGSSWWCHEYGTFGPFLSFTCVHGPSSVFRVAASCEDRILVSCVNAQHTIRPLRAINTSY